MVLSDHSVQWLYFVSIQKENVNNPYHMYINYYKIQCCCSSSGLAYFKASVCFNGRKNKHIFLFSCSKCLSQCVFFSPILMNQMLYLKQVKGVHFDRCQPFMSEILKIHSIGCSWCFSLIFIVVLSSWEFI